MAREVVPAAGEAHGNPVVRWTRELITFYNEVIVEMRKVVWPDRAQLKDMTIKIIIFVLFIGAVIAVIDVVFQAILVRGIPSLFAGH
ncbi:MAG TPA: preprotein translocase subunit SecE [Gemmatimonadaceae bacterium]|jgi:preprotein translocase SecE subunit